MKKDLSSRGITEELNESLLINYFKPNQDSSSNKNIKSDINSKFILVNFKIYIYIYIRYVNDV